MKHAIVRRLALAGMALLAAAAVPAAAQPGPAAPPPGGAPAQVASMWRRMAASRASTVGNTPRRIWRRVSRANQPLTRLSQDAEVGVKCRW